MIDHGPVVMEQMAESRPGTAHSLQHITNGVMVNPQHGQNGAAKVDLESTAMNLS